MIAATSRNSIYSRWTYFLLICRKHIHLFNTWLIYFQLKLFCHLVAFITNSLCHVLCSSVLFSVCLSVWLSCFLVCLAAFYKLMLTKTAPYSIYLINVYSYLLYFVIHVSVVILLFEYGNKCIFGLNWIEFVILEQS